MPSDVSLVQIIMISQRVARAVRVSIAIQGQVLPSAEQCVIFCAFDVGLILFNVQANVQGS